MHSEPSTQLYSPSTTTTSTLIATAAMSSSSRSRSPQPTRSRTHHSSPKNQNVSHLSNLPRFHPAVYQAPSSSSHTAPSQPAPSPLSQRPNPYRVPSGSRDALRQYRELVASVALAPRSNPSNISTKPSAPRLDPLGSPGPVTPLALEEDENYLVAGEMRSSDGTRFLNDGSGPSAELVEKLIQRESERLASRPNSGRIDTKAR